MKIYVVTSLIENREIGADLYVIGTYKTEEKAKEEIQKTLESAKKEYEENDIAYTEHTLERGILICGNNDEFITLEYTESEVK